MRSYDCGRDGTARSGNLHAPGVVCHGQSTGRPPVGAACPESEGDLQVAEPASLRLMAVHAHPDDESSKGAATMARYAHEGVDVLVVTCTGGERGDILNPAMDKPEVKENMAAIRKAEMAA